MKKGVSPKKHGLSYHPLYKIWTGIKGRCLKKGKPHTKNYGDIGVYMCEEWIYSPAAFIKWAENNGWKKGLHVDKDIIPKKLGIKERVYSPEMCSIVTKADNNRATRGNRNLEYNGQIKRLTEWSAILGINYRILYKRLKKMSVDKALSLPLNYKYEQITYKNKTLNLCEWAKELGIKRTTLYRRLNTLKLSIKEAFTAPLYYQYKTKQK